MPKNDAILTKLVMICSPVPLVSKPAVSPATRRAQGAAACCFVNLGHGRLGSLRHAKQIHASNPAGPYPTRQIGF
jgi:hypothetical protein